MKDSRELTKAVIMAGGKGTRLLDITGPLPKAMVNIRGTGAKYNGTAKDTILEHQIKILSENGIRDFILVVGNKKGFIERAFTDEIINQNVYTNVPGDRNLSIRFFEEGSVPLGTAGAFCFKELQEIIGENDFAFTYADTLFDVDFKKMYEEHCSKNADVTTLISANKEPDDRTIFPMDKNGEIISFIEKQGKGDGPREGLFPNNPQNGIMIIGNSFFSALPEEPTFLDMEIDVLKSLIDSPDYRVQGWVSPCYLKDIGVVSRYFEGVNDLKENIPSLRNPSKAPQPCVLFRESDLFFLRGGRAYLNSVGGSAISELNEAGIITVTIKDNQELNRLEFRDALVDTLLTRREGGGAYLNKTVNDLEEFKELARDWNISSGMSYLVEQEKNQDFEVGKTNCSMVDLSSGDRIPVANFYDASQQIIDVIELQRQEMLLNEDITQE